MQAAPLATDEAARLALLNAINILDSDPEAHFDRITALAARLLRMPISLVSLIDGDRQWFKSRHGLEAEQTSRDSAFCAHAILGDETLIVPDATKDWRFHDNPLVLGGPNIRFYAGAPLHSVDGVALGTLCIADVVPRQLLPEEDALLRDLAAVVSRELRYRELAARGQGNLLFQFVVPTGDRPVRFGFLTPPLIDLIGAPHSALLEDAAPFLRLVHPLDLPTLMAALRGRSTCGAEAAFALKVRLLEPGRRSPRWLQMRAAPRQLASGGQQWTGSFIDISIEREVELQQRETDRLRTATALVAGVAHDFNNILGSMIGLAELCRDQAESGSRLQRNLGHIHSAARKGAALIRQMLDYARQSPLSLRPSLLGSSIEALLPLVQVGLPRGVVVELNVADETPVMIDDAQMDQVVHNLIRNAGDAMQATGGLIRVSLDTCAAELSPLNLPSLRLRVADNGCGIAADDVGRVFDPFFTTKPVGEGTGLGLSSAQGIVVAHGGSIELESTPGRGSTFTVWLPSIVAAKAEGQAPTRAAGKVRGTPAVPSPPPLAIQHA